MPRRNVIVLLVLTMLFWAVNFHVTKIALQYYSPMGVAAWRFLFAAIVLVGVVAAQKKVKKHLSELTLINFGYIFLASFFGIYLTIYFFNKGLMTTSAVNGSLIVSLSPMITAVLASIFLNGKIKFIQWIAILFGFIGVAIVLVRGDLEVLRNLDLQIGDLYIFMMALCFSTSQIIVNKYLQYTDSIWLTTLGSILAVILFAGSSAGELSAAPIPSDWSFWWSIIFMGVLGTGVGYAAFFLAVVRLGATTSTLFMNLIPLFAVLLAIPFGETVYQGQLVGGAVIIGSLILFNRSVRQ